MSSLREPGRGPIVGHTTSQSCRLWIRAEDPEDSGAILAGSRRTLGVVALTKIDGVPVDNPVACYFRLHREFDRTGTFVIGEDKNLEGNDEGPAHELQPNTEYTVRLGTLTVDDTLDDDEILDDQELAERLPAAAIWGKELRSFPEKTSEATFRTFPGAGQGGGKLSFLLGSCRYPGLLRKVKLADRIFGPMGRHCGLDDAAPDRPPARFVLMVGDQIYADKLHRWIPIGRADTYEEFQERYLTAYGSRNMRRLLRNVPTYMILDDHEIEDNWTQDRLRRDGKRELFDYAIGAYMSYQWSHGPRSFGRRLFYQFTCAGYPFFVLDTRTQRFKDVIKGSTLDNHMLGRPSIDPDHPSQLDRLLDWLKSNQRENQNVPKFIVSASVFVPNGMDERIGFGDDERLDSSDSWPAYPETRRAILKCIVENGIQNVVFLSGDIHCSNVAEMHFEGSAAAGEIKAFSITSSAFYWPFPFADGDPSNYVHDSTAAGQEDTFDIDNGVVMNYRSWNFTQEDNFCRIDVDQDSASIKVSVFDDKGDAVAMPGASSFNLASWSYQGP